jgi:hypothetical protein
MIGTLIVCLPSRYEGGMLKIYKPGSYPKNTDENDSRKYEDTFYNIRLESVSYQYGHDYRRFGVKSAKREIRKLSWVAIYGDCVHSVEPVKEGNRITLTFDILKCEASKDLLLPLEKSEEEIDLLNLKATPHINFSSDENLGRILLRSREIVISEEKADLENPLFKRIHRLIQALDFPCIGFVLTHRYTEPALENLQLKGADQILVDSIRKSELCSENSANPYSFHLIPVVTKVCQQGGYEQSGSSQIYQAVYAMRSAELDFLTNRTAIKPTSPFKPICKNTRLNRSYVDDIGLGIPFYRFGPSYGILLDDFEQAYIEYTGNECQPYEYRATYFGAALVLEKK